MSGPRFRSTASFSVRQRQAAPHVERATFVIFAVDARRFAVPVEFVERVLRPEPGTTALYAGRTARRMALRDVLGTASAAADARAERTVIFSVQEAWVAADVETVHEVATIDAATVTPLPAEPTAAWGGAGAVWPPGSRGLFVRHGHDVVVLDMVRVLRALFARTTRDDETRS